MCGTFRSGERELVAFKEQGIRGQLHGDKEWRKGRPSWAVPDSLRTRGGLRWLLGRYGACQPGSKFTVFLGGPFPFPYSHLLWPISAWDGRYRTTGEEERRRGGEEERGP